jgi:hypothetical protein
MFLGNRPNSNAGSEGGEFGMCISGVILYTYEIVCEYGCGLFVLCHSVSVILEAMVQ